MKIYLTDERNFRLALWTMLWSAFLLGATIGFSAGFWMPTLYKAVQR